MSNIGNGNPKYIIIIIIIISKIIIINNIYIHLHSIFVIVSYVLYVMYSLACSLGLHFFLSLVLTLRVLKLASHARTASPAMGDHRSLALFHHIALRLHVGSELFILSRGADR